MFQSVLLLMAWLQISVEMGGELADAVAEVFTAIGAMSVTVLVAGDESLLEPAPTRMRVACNEIVIEGIKSNVALQKDIVTDCAFIEGGADIHYLEKKLGL